MKANPTCAPRSTFAALFTTLSVLFSIFLSTLLVAPSAHAQPEKSGRTLIYVEGHDAAHLRASIESALPSPALDASYTTAFVSELRKQGQKVPLGNAFDKAPTLAPRVGRAAEAMGNVSSVVLARSRTTRGARSVQIIVIDASGNVTANEKVALPKRAGPDDASPLRATLGPAISRATPSKPAAEPAPPPPAAPPPTEPETPAPATEEETASPAPPPHDPTRDLFAIGVGIELAMRRFHYRDPITANLSPYDITGAPLVAAFGEVFPLARRASGPGILRDIGLYGDYARSPGLVSRPSSGQKVDTFYSHWSLGVRARWHLSPSTLLAGALAYGAQDFTFSGAPTLAPILGSVAYRYVRPGIDARISLGGAAILASVGYRAVLSGGNVLSRFPRGKAGGVDMSLGLAVPFGTTGFEARLVGRYDRYFYAMNPEPGDTYVAGGALDQFISATLGVTYVY